MTQHLAILARFNRLLRDPQLRQALLTAATPEEVLSRIRESETER